MLEAMRRLGLGTAPVLALLAALLLLMPERGGAILATAAAALLLLVAGHLLIAVAGLPFLAVGALAWSGTWIAAMLAPLAGPVPALACAALGGALLLMLAIPLLTRGHPVTIAGMTLALAGIAGLLPAYPAMATPSQTLPVGVALAAAVLGLLLGDRSSRSSAGLALMAVRTHPGLAGLSGAEPGRLMLAPLAIAGLASAAAGGIVGLSHAPQNVANAAPATSIAVAVAIWVAGGHGLGMVMLVGLPLAVAPGIVAQLWPAVPDLHLPLAGAALLALLARRAWRHGPG